MRLLIVDNYDSFTFNLFQLAAEVFESIPTILPNDHDFDDIVARKLRCCHYFARAGYRRSILRFCSLQRIICELDLPSLAFV